MGVDPQKIVVIPNGVNTGYFVPPEEKKENILLFVGSLTDTKGCDVLIDAMHKVFEQEKKFRLIIIGEGPKKSDLERQAEILNIDHQITFLGAQSPSIVKKWMQKAKLFILPSRSEGFGVVLLEALACGTPCVGSNVGGITDILNEDVGKLVTVGNSMELSSAILYLLSDPIKLTAMSLEARRLVEEKFGWDTIIKKVIDIYRDVEKDYR